MTKHYCTYCGREVSIGRGSTDEGRCPHCGWNLLREETTCSTKPSTTKY